MRNFLSNTQVNGQPAVKTETHFDNGSIVESIMEVNTAKRVKVTVVHVSCAAEGRIIKSLYAQEYEEYLRMFLN